MKQSLAKSRTSSNHLPFLPKYISDEYSLFAEVYEPIAWELGPLYAEHWEETERAYKGAGYNADHEYYQALNKSGNFVPLTMRDDTMSLRGYFFLFFQRDLHRLSGLKALEGGIFITKSFRRGRRAQHFIKYAECIADRMGCSSLTMTCKSPSGGPNLGKLLNRQGYTHFANLYLKEVKGCAAADVTDLLFPTSMKS